MYTREEILKNRQIWIDYLKKPSRRKGRGMLDQGNGKRCCLGHACYVLGLDREWDSGLYSYDGEGYVAPLRLVEMLGLWDETGGNPPDVPYKFFKFRFHLFNLADINDSERISPQSIGNFLESVIEGGKDTPFRPLDHFPVAMQE